MFGNERRDGLKTTMTNRTPREILERFSTELAIFGNKKIDAEGGNPR
jgi:hypothetical protein